MKVFTLLKPFYYKLVALLSFIPTSFIAYSQFNESNISESNIERAATQSDKEYTFTIVLPVNFWETDWFKILTLLIVLVVALLITQFYNKSRLSKQRIQTEKTLAIKQERMRISTDMHDEIGSGLTTIRLLSEMARKKSDDREMMHDVEKIAAYSSDLSMKMREVIWSLNAESDTLYDLLSFLRRYVTDLFETADKSFQIDFPDYDENINIEISGQTRRDVFLAVKEALNNILKHADASNVFVRSIIRNDWLEIMVSDNGHGLKPESSLKFNGGNGLRNMQKHMDNVNGQLRIRSDKGTTISFMIPLEQQLTRVWAL